MRIKSTFLTLLFCLTHVLAIAQVCTITDLGPLTPAAINSWAQIAGTYNNEAYIWSFGRMRPLGTLPGGTSSTAAAINDLGVIAGTADGPGTVAFLDSSLDCGNLTQPFIWTLQKGMRGLGTAIPADQDGFWTSSACAIPFF